MLGVGSTTKQMLKAQPTVKPVLGTLPDEEWVFTSKRVAVSNLYGGRVGDCAAVSSKERPLVDVMS
jgi:hypothetical protein